MLIFVRECFSVDTNRPTTPTGTLISPNTEWEQLIFVPLIVLVCRLEHPVLFGNKKKYSTGLGFSAFLCYCTHDKKLLCTHFPHYRGSLLSSWLKFPPIIHRTGVFCLPPLLQTRQEIPLHLYSTGKGFSSCILYRRLDQKLLCTPIFHILCFLPLL